MKPEEIEQMKADMARPAVKSGSADDWRVVIDDPYPGWVEVRGPACNVRCPTLASDLNDEDYIARHADARRIARVPAMEAEILRMRGELASIKGACDSTKGEHVIMMDGKYKFCIHCGETMTTAKIKAAENFVRARAALNGEAP